MSACASHSYQEVMLRESYPEGTRDTLACGHLVWSTAEAEESYYRFCPLCVRTRRPPRRRPREGRPPGNPITGGGT